MEHLLFFNRGMQTSVLYIYLYHSCPYTYIYRSPSRKSELLWFILVFFFKCIP